MTEKKDDEAQRAFHQLVNGPELRLMSPGDLWLAAWSESRKRAGEEAVDVIRTFAEKRTDYHQTGAEVHRAAELVEEHFSLAPEPKP